MGYFNPNAIERARHNLNRARRNLLDARQSCFQAKSELKDSGRGTEATAVEMICASVEQLERDIIRWTELIGRSREQSQ